MVKESACNVGDRGLIPGLGRFPWRRKWQPIPVFSLGESHGWRSLVGYSPWGSQRVGHTFPSAQQPSFTHSFHLPSQCLALLCSCFLTETFQEPQSKSGPVLFGAFHSGIRLNHKTSIFAFFICRNGSLMWLNLIIRFLTEMSCVVSVYSWNSGSGESGLCVLFPVCSGPSRGSCRFNTC